MARESGPARERRTGPLIRSRPVCALPGDGHGSERLRVHGHAAAVGCGGRGRVAIPVGDGRRHGLLRDRLRGLHRRRSHRRSGRRRWRHRRGRWRGRRSRHGLSRSGHRLSRSGHGRGLRGRCGCDGRCPRLRRLGSLPHACVLAASPPHEHGDRGSRDHRHEDETTASAASARHVQRSHVLLPSHECNASIRPGVQRGVASRTSSRRSSAHSLPRTAPRRSRNTFRGH